MTGGCIRLVRGGIASLCLLTLIGCSESNPLGRQAISGNVTLNGAPLDQGTILFEPVDAMKGVGGGANIAAGKYSVPQEKGLSPGKYTVRISSADAAVTQPAEDVLPGEAPRTIAKERIPPSWNLQSDHQIEVAAEGDHVYNFDVK